MRFYDLLQLNPADLKREINNAENKKEKVKASIAIALRPALIVAFAIAIIAPLTKIFGSENNCLLVSFFCILLSVRFVDFGYCIKDSIINMGLTYLLLFAGPVLASFLGPYLGAVINCLCLLAILIMTSDDPIMGNGGLYGFSYVFMAGNPIRGDLILKRAILSLLAFTVCALIFYFKHRNKHKDIKFTQIAKKFSISNPVSLYQIKIALGVSLILLIGEAFNIERFMWAGFACSSLLSTYPVDDVKSRSLQRIGGTVIGTILFFFVYKITPESFHSLFGPLCGILLGFCVEYRYKTAINAFSALLLAAGLYGLSSALAYRMINNILGVVFAMVFALIFNKLFSLINEKRAEKNTEAA